MVDKPTVEKGRFSIPSRGIVKELMFNPSEITDGKNVNYGTLEIPGASHPVIQFGSGGERTLAFKLWLDGDRGQVARGEESLDISKHIQFYQSLVYPASTDSFDMRLVFPYELFFTFGPLYQQFRCVLKGPSLPVKILYWTPKLEPVRAEIDITLSELVDKTVTFDDVIPAGTIIGDDF